MTTEHMVWMTHEDELNLSVEHIGEAVYKIAAWVDKEGNRGYSLHALQQAHLPTKVLDRKYKAAWEEIVFEGEGRRRHDFDGWGVHKKTPRHWTRTWLERYGIEGAIGERLYLEGWEAAQIEHEARRVRRKMETVADQSLEEMKTIDVAYHMAAFAILCARARRRYFAERRRDVICDMQVKLYALTSQAFRDELHYRMKAKPQKRRTKTATVAAWNDWEKAAGFIEEGPQRFFTQDYIDQCVASETDPDLSVDYENLPRGTMAQTPIIRLPDRDLVAEFMKLLDGQDEFEREDAQTILRALRPMLARAKGQGGTVATTITRDEAEV